MAITITNLTKRYGGFTAVNELSLQVQTGETYALLGPNGAGKTTTVEILEGLRKADGGSVSVLDLDPIADHDALQRKIGVMLQEGGMYPGAKAMEVLTLFSSFHHDPASPSELLEMVGLSDKADSVIRRMSGGEKQRLSLALALIGKPELIFLDEPTAGMDPVARRATWAIIERLQNEGVTMLLTTHFMDEAERLADRVGIIANGSLIAEGTPGELISAGGLLSFSTNEVLDTDAMSRGIGHEIHHVGTGRYTVENADPTPQLIAALAGWLAEHDVLVNELRIGAAGLEDVFLKLTDDQ